MKSFILASITITALLSTGCGSSDNSCCNSGNLINKSVIVPLQVKEQPTKEVIATIPPLGVTEISLPTPIINFNDEKPIISKGTYTFDCNKSIPSEAENNESEIIQCDWDIHSLDDNGEPYVDCSIKNTNSHTVHICELAAKIIATLTVTDNNGKSSSVTQEYNITK